MKRLKTLKGSIIKRSKYGVGKLIGGCLYLHKSYSNGIIPQEVLTNAKTVLKETYPDFEYQCLKYDIKKQSISFQEAPDFNSAREPIVGDYVTVTIDGKVKTGHSNYIWHHKWLWVKDDYTGFDIEDSYRWSEEWLAVLEEPADGNGVERWRKQLERYGLE